MAILKFIWLAIRPASKLESAVGWWDVLHLLIIAAYPTTPQFLDLSKWLSKADLIWFIAIPAILFLIAGIKLQRRVNNYEKQTTVLKINGPFQRLDDVDTNELPRWYVTVENTKQNTCAKNVCVQITNPTPLISTAFPIVLHRLHDNNRPFQQTHNVRYGEPITFDLFACGQTDPDMFYLYRADGDESSQLGPEWMLNEDDNTVISDAIRQTEGWRFDLTAVADPPTSLVRMTLSFRVTEGRLIAHKIDCE